MRHAIIAVLAVLLLAAPAESQERVEPQVLYCVDEGIAGFEWDENDRVQPTQLKAGLRFMVNVVSETERIVRLHGIVSVSYTCQEDEFRSLHCRQTSGPSATL